MLTDIYLYIICQHSAEIRIRPTGKGAKMKKNILSVLLITVICITTLCACGGSSVTSTIVANDGSVAEMTVDELTEIYNENEAKFEKKYQNAEVTINGIVKSVSSKDDQIYSTPDNISSRMPMYTIELDEGWIITVLAEFHEEVIDLSEGDKVQIVSCIDMSDMSGVATRVLAQNMVYKTEKVGSNGFKTLELSDNTKITVVE